MKNINKKANKKFAKELILKYPKFSSVKYSKENLYELMELIKTEIMHKLNKPSVQLMLWKCVDLNYIRINTTDKNNKSKEIELALTPFKNYKSSVTVNNYLVSVLGVIFYRKGCYEIELNKIYFEESTNKSYALSLIDTLAHEIIHGFVFNRFENTNDYLEHASRVHANDGHMFFEKCLELVGVTSTETESELNIYHVFQCEEKGCVSRICYLRKSVKIASRYTCALHGTKYVYIGKHSSTTLDKADSQDIEL